MPCLCGDAPNPVFGVPFTTLSTVNFHSFLHPFRRVFADTVPEESSFLLEPLHGGASDDGDNEGLQVNYAALRRDSIAGDMNGLHQRGNRDR